MIDQANNSTHPSAGRMIGRRYGKLTVVKFSHSNDGAHWVCLCDCGNMTIRSTGSLNYRKKKHQHAQTCGCGSQHVLEDGASTVKPCSKCKSILPVSSFSRQKNTKTGYSSICKSCYAEWKERNRDSLLEKKREYHRKNAGAISEYRKSDEYKEKTREAMLLRCMKYVERNPERRRQSANLWARKNKAYNCARENLRRAKKLQATPAWANEFSISQIYRLSRLKSLITGQKWHVDHIVPLVSDIVCGLHCEANLRIIKAKDNISKSNRRWPEMP